MVVEGILDPALLSLLVEGDSYGYELATELGRRGIVPQRVTPARVYEVLRLMEAEGAVMSNPETSPSGPDRRRYELTETGRVWLDRWMEALRLTDRSLHELLNQYGNQRKESDMMGCSCCGGNGQQSNEQTRPESNTEVLQARVAQLEAELRAAKLEVELRGTQREVESRPQA